MIDDLITWDLCLGDSSTSRYPRKQFHANDDGCIRIDQKTDSPYIRLAKYISFGNLKEELDEEDECYDEGIQLNPLIIITRVIHMDGWVYVVISDT